jgi:hypothetical protein
MSDKYCFVADEEFFLNTGYFKNPIGTLDHKLQQFFPNFSLVHYDLRIIAHKIPVFPKSKVNEELREKCPVLFFDPFIEVSLSRIDYLKEIALNKLAKTIYLNGFTLEQFKYIVPYIKNTAEIIFFNKCNSIDDLSILSEFPNLQCVHIYWNNKLKSLWDMKGNKRLKALSFDFITKLQNVDGLKESTVEYLCLSGESPSGYKVDFLVEDKSVFQKVPNLKHLTLNFKKLWVDY